MNIILEILAIIIVGLIFYAVYWVVMANHNYNKGNGERFKNIYGNPKNYDDYE